MLAGNILKNGLGTQEITLFIVDDKTFKGAENNGAILATEAKLEIAHPASTFEISKTSHKVISLLSQNEFSERVALDLVFFIAQGLQPFVVDLKNNAFLI